MKYIAGVFRSEQSVDFKRGAKTVLVCNISFIRLRLQAEIAVKVFNFAHKTLHTHFRKKNDVY